MAQGQSVQEDILYVCRRLVVTLTFWQYTENCKRPSTEKLRLALRG